MDLDELEPKGTGGMNQRIRIMEGGKAGIHVVAFIQRSLPWLADILRH